MNTLHPKKSYKLNYLAVIPPTMAILSEIGVWMPILNIFSIFLGIMGILFGAFYIVKIKRSTKKKISEFGLIALGNITWMIAMLTCAVMKFSSASYSNDANSDFINQIIGFKYYTNENDKSAVQETREETDSQSKESNKSKCYEVNDTVRLKGVKMTLTDVKKKFKMNGEYSNPKQGSQLIKVNVKIENDSESEINVSENDIKIKDSSGAMENPIEATNLLADKFESAVLLPGGIREGAVIFEVPENDNELKLIYTFPHDDGARVEFNL